jgi:hypothetical protein
VADYPIKDKKGLIAALKELSSEDLEASGLSKKDTSTSSSEDKARKKTYEALATRELTKALEQYAATLKILKQNKDDLGLGESMISELLGVKTIEEAEALLEISKGLKDTFDGMGNSIAKSLGFSPNNKLANSLDSISKKAASAGFVLANAFDEGNMRMLGIAAAAVSIEQVLEGVFAVVTSVATSIINMSKTVILAFDQAQAKINAATGATYKFNDSLYTAQRSVNTFGVTFDETSNSILALNRGLSFFVSANEKTQSKLAGTVAALTKFGISAEESTKLLSYFTNNLGMTAIDADEATKQLAMLSTSIGIDPSKMTADFMKASSSLAVYGQRSVKVFSNIAAAAKAAEVETSSLISLADKFDTFAGAADTAGKLNAILGTQLSTLEMIGQSEDQRIETLIRSVQSQGMAFDQMDKFTQKAIASAAGISDLNEAQKIFGMNISQYRDMANQQQKSQDIQQKFNDALRAGMPLVDKFKVLFTEFIITLTPAFNALNDFMDGVLDFVQSLEPSTKSAVAAFVLGFTIMTAIVISLGTALLGLFASVIMPLNLGFLGNVIATRSAGSALKDLAGNASSVSNGMPKVTKAIADSNTKMSAFNKVSSVANSNMTTLSRTGPQAAAGLGAGFKRAAFGVGIAVIAILAIAGAIALVLNYYSKLADAEARQEEAKARQIEAYSNLGESISQVQEALTNIANIDLSSGIAQVIELGAALSNFDDVSIETKHTLTNLALITTGTAAEVMTAGAAGQTFNIDNVVQNAITLEGIKVNVKIGEQEFADAVMNVVRNAQ